MQSLRYVLSRPPSHSIQTPYSSSLSPDQKYHKPGKQIIYHSLQHPTPDQNEPNFLEASSPASQQQPLTDITTHLSTLQTTLTAQKTTLKNLKLTLTILGPTPTLQDLQARLSASEQEKHILLSQISEFQIKIADSKKEAKSPEEGEKEGGTDLVKMIRSPAEKEKVAKEHAMWKRLVRLHLWWQEVKRQQMSPFGKGKVRFE